MNLIKKTEIWRRVVFKCIQRGIRTIINELLQAKITSLKAYSTHMSEKSCLYSELFYFTLFPSPCSFPPALCESAYLFPALWMCLPRVYVCICVCMSAGLCVFTVQYVFVCDMASWTPAPDMGPVRSSCHLVSPGGVRRPPRAARP